MQTSLKIRIGSLKLRTEQFLMELFYWFRHKLTGRKFVVIRNGWVGIGNRLFDLANMYCCVGKKNIVLTWGLDKWVGEPFENLFEMCDAPGFIVKSKVCRWLRHHVDMPELPGWGGVGNFWQLWAPPVLSYDMKPYGKLFMMYNETPQWAIDLYGAFFQQLKPSHQVQARIDAVSLPSDIVCVQLRNSNRNGDAAGVARPQKFFDVMRTYGEGQQFFVSCMEKEISELVCKEFPGQIVELPAKDYRSMVDAVADMWLLGQGRELIVQNGSTFAECGWWWRGCKAKVTKVLKDYVQGA